MSDAVGMIETRGLVGAITAADAALKTANVTLKGAERVDPALVTVMFTGEVAAVRAAVDAGAAAAEKIGELVARHVIPRPHEEMAAIFDPVSQPAQTAGSQTPADSAPPARKTASPSRQDLDRLPVTELRRLARKIPDSGLRGREISGATRQELIQALARTSES